MCTISVALGCRRVFTKKIRKFDPQKRGSISALQRSGLSYTWQDGGERLFSGRSTLPEVRVWPTDTSLLLSNDVQCLSLLHKFHGQVFQWSLICGRPLLHGTLSTYQHLSFTSQSITSSISRVLNSTQMPWWNSCSTMEPYVLTIYSNYNSTRVNAIINH